VLLQHRDPEDPDDAGARSHEAGRGTMLAPATGMSRSVWYAPSVDMPAKQGPFRPEHVNDGDRYEISSGHPVHVAPAGGRHGKEHLVGALPLSTDPAVQEIGIDVGYALDERTLRAPDISIGNVPDAPGWARGAPRLAVEYADVGTDESDLQTKIEELLRAGTELLWVARLTGPRRVDVHARGVPARTVPAGGLLEAPGILSRALPVDALFDHRRADEIALANLLDKYGYGSLDAVRADARAEGRAEGETTGRAAALRGAIETLCHASELPIDEARRAALDAADQAALEAIFAHLARHRAWPRARATPP